MVGKICCAVAFALSLQLGAYTITIINKRPAMIYYTVNYHSFWDFCKHPDTGWLAAGGTARVNAKGCCVSNFSFQDDYHPNLPAGITIMSGNKDFPGSGMCGNWTVTVNANGKIDLV